MLRRDVLRELTAVCAATEVFSVATMQAVPVWHELAPDLPLHVDMLGCMGSASSFGLGLALGMPQRPVLVVDGDGSLMMQLATLVSIGDIKPSNLTLAVMHNRRYETSGNQLIPGALTADIAQLALAAGFRRAVNLENIEDLARDARELITGTGPTMMVLEVDVEEPCANFPALSMKAQIEAARRALFVHA